jgi:PIN domain nuclease of toxin-antitoxin system
MGVTYLLDTHVLLWLLSDPAKVDASVRRRIANRDRSVLVSAASALEVATKWRLGKLPAGEVLIDGWDDRLSELGCEELAVTSRHALIAGSLSWSHRDPFDRLLVAQALTTNATLVTSDQRIKGFPGIRMLSW